MIGLLRREVNPSAPLFSFSLNGSGPPLEPTFIPEDKSREADLWFFGLDLSLALSIVAYLSGEF